MWVPFPEREGQVAAFMGPHVDFTPFSLGQNLLKLFNFQNSFPLLYPSLTPPFSLLPFLLSHIRTLAISV